jgi:hypothetical protein
MRETATGAFGGLLQFHRRTSDGIAVAGTAADRIRIGNTTIALTFETNRPRVSNLQTVVKMLSRGRQVDLILRREL